MSRRVAREAAMCLLYAWDISGQSDLDAVEQSIDEAIDVQQLDRKDYDYISQVVPGVVESAEQIDDLLRPLAEGWKLERISRVDHAILRLAVYEMQQREDVPESVAINEAVELAKRYGTDKSGSFVNGILGSISRSKDAVKA
ncbi:transcription antitermination factor NusB [Eubacteriales bacterium OttesenSCG-928-N14]|nr:transcription antitermination factor NusB [Eubacteriales bacterium OttesenSCG-928-N14]